MVTLTPIPDRTLIVLRNEAKAARAGTMVVSGVDIDMAELLEDAAAEIVELRKAVAAEREACARLADEHSAWTRSYGAEEACEMVAKAIRSR